MVDPAHFSADLSTDEPPKSGSHDPEAHPQSAAPDPTGRREFVRTSVVLTVEIVSQGTTYPGTTENLSPGGVFVCSEHLLEPDENVDLLIHLPNASTITAHGVVRWIRAAHAAPGGAGMGIQFRKLEGALPRAETR
jgi:Tfp pilus assembly protein PilZ